MRPWDPEWERYQERAVEKGYAKIEDTDLIRGGDGEYKRRLMEDHTAVSRKFPGADAEFIKNYQERTLFLNMAQKQLNNSIHMKINMGL